MILGSPVGGIILLFFAGPLLLGFGVMLGLAAQEAKSLPAPIGRYWFVLLSALVAPLWFAGLVTAQSRLLKAISAPDPLQPFLITIEFIPLFIGVPTAIAILVNWLSLRMTPQRVAKLLPYLSLTALGTYVWLAL